MNELVYRKENQVLTNSRLVAMKFGKRHSNVIRDIEELLVKLPENERKLNFEQIINFKNYSIMNELKIFKNEEFGEVRTMLINGEPYFVGKDVASVLGYSNTRNAILQHVDSEDALKQGVPDSQGFTQQTTLINESGLYSLIFGSKLESAKSFKRWVTSEVLPAIRKTGSYNLPSYQIENPIQRAEAWIQEEKERQSLKEQTRQLAEENKNLENQIEEDLPKVIFAMAVTESKRSCLVAELAKIICQNGMEIG